MPMDGFTLSFMARELNEKLAGGSMCLRAHQRAFLGEKQSARPALPYTPLVASLISRF